MAQAHHVFLARQHRKRITGSRVDYDELDRVRTYIYGSDFHARGIASVDLTPPFSHWEKGRG
jgi:hypothetical protein